MRKLTDLSDRFNEFTSKYDKVYSELQQCKSCNSHLLTRVIQLERNAVTNSHCNNSHSPIYSFLQMTA